MKNYKPGLLICLFCLVGFQIHAQENEYNLDETYSISENGTIHLNSDDAEVEINGTDRSDVHLGVYRRVDIDGWKINSEGTFKIEVDNRDGDLYIREAETERRRFIVGNVREEYRISIETPRDISLDLRGDDDSYEISDVNLGMQIDADDSEIELRGAGGDNFDFNIDDGKIRMDEGQGRLKIRMDDGEFYIRQADFKEIDADFDDGEVDITTTLADDGFYIFDMDDGDIELNIAGGGGEFDVHHDDRSIFIDSNFEEVSSGENRSVYRLSGGNARIEIDTDDGDVELRII